MNVRIWRIILAVGLVAGVVAPTTRPVRAAPCSSLRNVVALANGVGPQASLLAGTSDSGLYQSADGGRCWTRFASYPRGFSVGTVLAPPHHPGVLIAGGRFLTTTTQLKASLYRSDDAGKTWRSGNAGLPRTPILPDAAGGLPTRHSRARLRLPAGTNRAQAPLPAGPRAKHRCRSILAPGRAQHGKRLRLRARRGRAIRRHVRRRGGA